MAHSSNPDYMDGFSSYDDVNYSQDALRTPIGYNAPTDGVIGLKDTLTPQSKTNEIVRASKILYGKILDDMGLNVKDPIAANIGYFNSMGKVIADPPSIGRTYIFITKPNLNFANPINITRSRIFQYYMSTKLGRSLMQQLMHDESKNEIRDFLGRRLYFNSSIIPKTETGPSTADFAPYRGFIGGYNISGMKGDLLPTIESPFMPMISNLCTETSGSKDINLGQYETEPDFSGNKLVYASGADDTLSIGEINLNFKDLYYSPVLHTFILWVLYINYVCKDICVPFYEYIVNRIIDYTCSIYVFMTDMDQQTIIRYCKYSGCFPKTAPFGQIQHSNDPNQQSLRELQIPFAYNFYDPQNPLILSEFNMLALSSLARRCTTRKEPIDPRQYIDYKKFQFKNNPWDTIFKGTNTSLEIDYIDALGNEILKESNKKGSSFIDACPPPLPQKLTSLEYDVPFNKNDIFPTNLYAGNYLREIYDSANTLKRGVNPFLMNRSFQDIISPYFGHPVIVDNKLIFI